MTLSLDHLKAFYYSIKYGTLKKASTHMGISLSAVSNQIILLEKELSLKLMIRNKGGVKLTSEGQTLLNMIQNTIPALEIIPDFFQQETELKGDIKLETWPGVASFAISNYIKNFVETYKDVRVIVKCQNSDAADEEWLSDVSIRPYVEHRTDLIQTKIFSVKFNAYSSKEYLELYGHPSEYKDLDHHRLIGAYDPTDIHFSAETDWHLTIGSEIARKPCYVVNSSFGILHAIKNGLGIGTLPTYYKPESYGLIELFSEVNAPIIDFYYIYPTYLEKIKRIKALEKYLVETLANL